MTARGSLAHGGPAAEDAEVVAPAARRGRGRSSARRTCPELEALARRSRSPSAPRATRGTSPRIAGGSSGGSARRGRRRAWSAPRSPPTAPARSASPPRAAGSSGSSRSATALPMRERLARAVGDRRGHPRRARHRALPRRGRRRLPGYADARRARRAPAARRGLATRCRAASSCGSATSSAPPSTGRPSACASSATSSSSAIPTTATPASTSRPATSRAPERRRGDAASRAAGALDARAGEHGAASCPASSSRAPARQEAADRERAGALFAEFDALLDAGGHARRRRGSASGSACRRRVMLNAMASFIPYLPLWNHTGNPAVALPVEADADGLAARRPARRADRTASRCCSGSPRSSRPTTAGPRGGRRSPHERRACSRSPPTWRTRRAPACARRSGGSATSRSARRARRPTSCPTPTSPRSG